MSLKIAQITDCHLKADKQADFYGCQPYQNLIAVLTDINNQQPEYQAIVLTGDLVQDEVWQSYQHFLDALHQFNWQLPIYLIPGNHDKPDLFEQFSQDKVFSKDKVIALDNWLLILFNSYHPSQKGAGYISTNQLAKVKQTISLNPQASSAHWFVFLHHHLVPFNSFIDQYDLQDSTEFKLWLTDTTHIKAIAHGHVHSKACGVFNGKPWYACPASSVQFAHSAQGFAITDNTPGYQQITLSTDGSVRVKTCLV